MAKARKNTPKPTSRTRLESWKEIAAYLRRDVTTVRRWEKREALPVHRHQHGRLGSVYAFGDEIDAWRERRSALAVDRSADGQRSNERSEVGRNATGAFETHASLVVLPFANLSPVTEDEYFSDGLAEEIINTLGHIGGLRVIARTSSFAFKGIHEDIRRIAATLGVTNVLEGSVRRDGTRIRVVAQLIRATDGSHVWSERYDRELVDVFAMQDDIATAIAGALKLTLIPDASLRPYVPGVDAYEAFLKGRYHLPSRRVVDVRETVARAEQYFREASAVDPRWAEPHTSLAYLYFHLGRLGARPVQEMMARARAEATHALELEVANVRGHAVLGAIVGTCDYDWTRARHHFQCAMASDGVEPAVHDLFAQSYLLPRGQFDEAVREIEKAIARDPLNLMWRERRITLICSSGKYKQAIDAARKVLDYDDHSFLAHLTMASSHLALGNLADALAAAGEAYRLAPWNPSAVGLLAGVLEKAGDGERAASILTSLRQMNSPVGMLNYHLASSHVDAALNCLVQAIEERHPMALQMIAAEFLTPLRSSRRWSDLMKTVNLAAGPHHLARPARLRPASMHRET